MSTTISLDEQDRAYDEAVAALSKGSVVVLPVGGVYAIVADAFRPAATQRIFAARRRARGTPLPVLIRSERQVSGLVSEVPETADRLMAAYWPGDLTLILPASEGMSWDLGASKGTVQLRRPTDDFLLRLIGEVGPLACTAANRVGQPPPTTVEMARVQLGVLVPVYLDGGDTDGQVSTIVDLTGQSVVVVREGRVPEHDLRLVATGELPWGERPAPAAAPRIGEDLGVEQEPDPAAEGIPAAEEDVVGEGTSAEEVVVEGTVVADDAPDIEGAEAVQVTLVDTAEDTDTRTDDDPESISQRSETDEP